MRVSNLTYWLQYKRLLLIIAGVVLLISVAAAAAPRISSQTQKNAEADSKNLSASSAVSVAPSSKQPATAQSTQPTNSQKSAQATPNKTKPAADAPSTLSTTDTEKICSAVIPPLLEDYNKEVTRNKTALDSQITYPLAGSSMIKMYIDEFNGKSSEAYKKFAQIAAESHCSFPAKLQPLPDSYLPSGL